VNATVTRVGEAPDEPISLLPWMCQAMEAREMGSPAWSDLGLPLFLVIGLIVNAPILWVFTRWFLTQARPMSRERVKTGAWVLAAVSLIPFLMVLGPLASGFIDLGSARGGSIIKAVRGCDPGEYWLGIWLLWLPFLMLVSAAMSFVVRVRRVPYRKHVQHQNA
jgi:hypothetical protein